VLDNDRSFASRELAGRFQPPYFKPGRRGRQPRRQPQAARRGDAMAVLDIPPRFEERLTRGEQVPVQLQDTTNSVLGFASSYAAQIVGRRRGGDAAEGLAGSGGPMIEAETRIWYNPNQNDPWFMGISELLTVVTLFSILLPAAAMVREKERGTIEQLMVTPSRPSRSSSQGHRDDPGHPRRHRHRPVRRARAGVRPAHARQPGPSFLITALYVFTTAGLGLLAATVSRNLAQVGMLTIVILMPMLLLSGAWTPLRPCRRGCASRRLLAAALLPDSAYGILLKGAGMDLLWDSVLAMGARA
jgi:ABC-2 type transport system permease protein